MTARILVGDALDMLRTLDAGSVQVCVTSPPYFGLRDYGTATWEGGDAECKHQNGPLASSKSTLAGYTGDHVKLAIGGMPYREQCGKCGAVRTDGQIGLEQTPAEFVSKLVAVFDEVKRVLRPDGLCFVNLGDSYAGSGKGPTGGNGIGDQESRQGFVDRNWRKSTIWSSDSKQAQAQSRAGGVAGIPAKNLLLIPERFAIAMQDAGWVVRSRIAWCKKSSMPESVRDRPTSAWEHIWMFSKSARYFYDAEAVRQRLADTTISRDNASPRVRYQNGGGSSESMTNDARSVLGHQGPSPSEGANLRNYWLLGPSPFADAHFATFPPEIPRRCILAGTSEKGACPACGAPWARVVERERSGRPLPHTGNTKNAAFYLDDTNQLGPNVVRVEHTLGWAPSCHCPPADPVPCVVLDPFLGSGTTALVADQLGRDAVGIELSPKYAAMAEQRIAGDCPMFTSVEVIQGMTRDMMGQHDDAAS